MQFEIRALDHDNVMTLRVEARDEADARAQLRAQMLRPLSLRPVRNGLGRADRGARLSLILFSQELVALLEGGLTIVEAIDVLCEKETRSGIRDRYASLARGLTEGKSFSACLGEQADLFPPLYVGMVQSAERTSSLDAALARYIDYQTRLDAVRGKIVSASIYPAILLVVGLGVIAFLGTYVVPRFATVYRSSGRPLPLLSGWLLAWGSFASAHARELAIAALLLVVASIVAVSYARASGALARALYLLPYLAERARVYDLTRLYLSLGMLLQGGLPVTQALILVRGATATHRRPALDAAMRDIGAGESFSEAFERAGLTTPVALRFMRVGERSGRLGEMLNRSARYYDGEISRWIERFTRAFEPLLMTAIGAIVGLIVVLLYMPIFDLAGSFQQ